MFKYLRIESEKGMENHIFLFQGKISFIIIITKQTQKMLFDTRRRRRQKNLKRALHITQCHIFLRKNGEIFCEIILHLLVWKKKDTQRVRNDKEMIFLYTPTSTILAVVSPIWHKRKLQYKYIQISFFSRTHTHLLCVKYFLKID